MNDKDTLEQIRSLVEKTPCQLCKKNGSLHIEEDSGCRHRPITNEELLVRLEQVISG